MTLNTALGSSSSNTYYYHSDGNGNVMMLANAAQYVVAKYLYDAFGNVLSASGVMAQQNLYRFSSKEAHVNSGLVYYLYRYYDPNLQRWPNRDPILETGWRAVIGSRPRSDTVEANSYVFAGNAPTGSFDAWGNEIWICPLPWWNLPKQLIPWDPLNPKHKWDYIDCQGEATQKTGKDKGPEWEKALEKCMQKKGYEYPPYKFV
jgi:RHS repeat-associated protein